MSFAEVKESVDAEPLLAANDFPVVAGESYKLSDFAGNDDDHLLEMIEIEDGKIENDFSDEYYFNYSIKKKQKNVTMVFHDAFFLILNYLQLYSLVLACSLLWTWPTQWMFGNRFMFLFNLDIWEFMKLQPQGAYTPVSEIFTPSAKIGIDYRYYILTWGIFIVGFISWYIFLYVYFQRHKNPNSLTRTVKLQRICLFFCECLALPVGVMVSKLFHCTTEGKMDVYNSVDCWSGEHFAFILPASFVTLFLFIFVIIWMIRKIRAQVFSPNKDRHEGYIQLKETEYAYSLDYLWAINHFHLFSSFQRRWIYYRPIMLVLKLVYLIIYASLFNENLVQVALLLFFTLVMFLSFCIFRTFRVVPYNVHLIFTSFTLMCNLILGTLQNLPNLNSPWFTTEYLFLELLIIQSCWALFTVCWLLYILFRYLRLGSKSRFLWPTMTSHGMDNLSKQTKKYMMAQLQGRVLLEYSLKTVPIFCPVHELGRQIQIINAYCREAELICDPLHDALWDLLDELIEAHSRTAPYSLFSESVKKSIRQTAAELIELLPIFKQRLAQRDHDFVLVSPIKRRMLLKMYCIGIFVNGRIRNQAIPEVTTGKLYDPQKSLVMKTRNIKDFHRDGDFDFENELKEDIIFKNYKWDKSNIFQNDSLSSEADLSNIDSTVSNSNDELRMSKVEVNTSLDNIDTSRMASDTSMRRMQSTSFEENISQSPDELDRPNSDIATQLDHSSPNNSKDDLQKLIETDNEKDQSAEREDSDLIREKSFLKAHDDGKAPRQEPPELMSSEAPEGPEI